MIIIPNVNINETNSKLYNLHFVDMKWNTQMSKYVDT